MEHQYVHFPAQRPGQRSRHANRRGEVARTLPGGHGMNADVMRNHYDRLAATFEQNWAYSPEFVDWMTGCLQRRLRIGDGDVVADIGCGTGLYSRGLAVHAAAVVGVEPSAPMLAQARRSSG